MSIEDQPTQQLRRPSEPPMPAPLNPTRPQAAAPAATPDDGGTDVLSLDNLFERQNVATAPQATTAPPATTPPPTAQVATAPPAGPAEPPSGPAERRVADRRAGADRRVGDRRVGVVPVAAGHATVHRQPGLGSRVKNDTGTAVRGGVTRTRDWFTAGDHALIVVTALVALALVLVIGLV